MEFNCTAPGCTVTLTPETALVPSIAAMRQVIGKEVRAGDLAAHVHCRNCAWQARRQAARCGAEMKFFPYQASVRQVEEFVARRVARESHFGRYMRSRNARPERKPAGLVGADRKTDEKGLSAPDQSDPKSASGGITRKIPALPE